VEKKLELNMQRILSEDSQEEQDLPVPKEEA
jgi:hypothetical protein